MKELKKLTFLTSQGKIITSVVEEGKEWVRDPKVDGSWLEES